MAEALTYLPRSGVQSTPTTSELVEQAGDPLVDALGAVIGVEAVAGEGEDHQQRGFEDGERVSLGEAFDRPDDLVRLLEALSQFVAVAQAHCPSASGQAGHKAV